MIIEDNTGTIIRQLFFAIGHTMTQPNRLTLLFVCFVFFLIPNTGTAAFVKSFRTYLYPNPDLTSDPLDSIQRGQTVTPIQTTGPWTQVSLGEKTGWVMRLAVSDSPILEKISIPEQKKKLQKLISTKKRKNIRLRVARTVIGVKGLRSAQTDRIEDDESDFESVKKVENQSVTESEATQFLNDYQE